MVCKQGYVPVGVDGSVKGWQEDFLKEIGLEDLAEDNFLRMGGVSGVVSLFCNLYCQVSLTDPSARMVNTFQLASLQAHYPRKQQKS